ncbi:ROK family protein [[Mycoplasma] mobile]|uniref:Putative sugar binding signalling protein n=1 Tax=Mycoplasma mobile (strain ATCC 43663 / 163K / NCTC 11711) TaxID=267748 RepID=Q6KI87_MYCM1|nr:ROK family protein [[Mycoplasma] mobile]AAT27689.1 putative sugar binding signalling protein [Mycoplasma mobile 163K]
MKIGSIDIGGTNARIAIFENDVIIRKFKFPTDINSPEISLKPIIEKINEENLEYIALCVPGPTDYKNGIVLYPPTMPGWWNFKLKEYLNKNTRIKDSIFENDANAMAMAVHREFNQTFNDVTQFFTISTGLGAGLVIKDEVFIGVNHAAQEINSLPASFIKESGGNNSMGGVELFSSGSGLENRAKRRNYNWKAKEMFELYDKNVLAKRLIDEGIETLANLIAISLAMLNPSQIVFGGTVALKNKWYVEAAIKQAKSRSLAIQYDNVKFRFTSYEDDTALYGLYHIVKNKFTIKN